jgi:hypothetical protein
MRRFALIAVVAAMTAPAAGGAGGAGKTKPAPPAEGPFAGKVLMVYTRNPARGAVLQDVRVKQLGDRFFLVGKTAPRDDRPSGWTGRTLWVPVDQVSEIFEFPSVEAARKAHAEAEKSRFRLN